MKLEPAHWTLDTHGSRSTCWICTCTICTSCLPLAVIWMLRYDEYLRYTWFSLPCWICTCKNNFHFVPTIVWFLAVSLCDIVSCCPAECSCDKAWTNALNGVRMPGAHAIDQSECNDDVLFFFVWITFLFRSPCQPICQTPSREHLDARTWRDLQSANVRHFQTWNLNVCKPSRMLPTFCLTWCLESKNWQIHEN